MVTRLQVLQSSKHNIFLGWDMLGSLRMLRFEGKIKCLRSEYPIPIPHVVIEQVYVLVLDFIGYLKFYKTVDSQSYKT